MLAGAALWHSQGHLGPDRPATVNIGKLCTCDSDSRDSDTHTSNCADGHLEDLDAGSPHRALQDIRSWAAELCFDPQPS